MFNLKETKAQKFYYNRLYHDFIFNFSRVGDYYFYDYHRRQDFERRAGDVIAFYKMSQRQQLAEILENINSGLNCGSKVISNIDKIRKDDTFIVIGGQQPGFFTGPVFIIYKILSIIKLSEYITRSLNLNAVPVFWIASDDSNFSQIDSLYILDDSLKKIGLELQDIDNANAGKRFSDVFLPEKIYLDKIEELSENLQKTDFTEKINDFLIRSTVETGRSFSDDARTINPAVIFSKIISKLFSKYGLIVLDPSHPDLKSLLVSSSLFDLKNSVEVNKAVQKAGGMLLNQGYHEQLNIDANSMNFFMVKNGTRHKVRRDGNGMFLLDGNKYSEEELERMLEKEPGEVSPNVVLRPLYQDTVLPVVATVCGPGEISYFAQLKDVYNLAGIKTGVICPRFSGTIIEKKILKSMKRAGVTIEDLGHAKQQVIDRKIADSDDKGIDDILEQFENDTYRKLQDLKSRIMSGNLDVGSSFDRIERNLKKEYTVLKKKIYSELKNKDNLAAKDVEKIYLNIFPGDDLQERTINIFNYINKYDFCLLDSIYDNIDPVSGLHKFMIFNNL